MSGDCSTVRAKYTFNGKNNDELNFMKNDIIVITQKPDGGWWEGTLCGKTGWFPSNYVIEIEKKSAGTDSTAVVKSGSSTHARRSPGKESPLVLKPEQRNEYRDMVLNDLIDSERKHVKDLRNLFSTYLQPLSTADVLTNDEYSRLVGNIEEIILCQLKLMSALEENATKPNEHQHVGAEFMKLAPAFKDLLRIYCNNHPLAVEVINKHKSALEKYMADQGGGNLIMLIQGLSTPFRRLEKYPPGLQELERIMEENHTDRGDTQRAVSVYRDLVSLCGNVRRQREMQVDLMAGSFEGLDGGTIEQLGDIQQMSSVLLTDRGVSNDKKDDRIVVLFPNDLVIFSVDVQTNSYQFRRRVPLRDLVVKRQEASPPGPYSLELSGSSLSGSLVFLFARATEQSDWFERFQLNPSVASCEDETTCNVISPSEPLRFDTVQTDLSPAVKPQVSTLPSPGVAELKKSSTLPPGMSLATANAQGLSSSEFTSSKSMGGGLSLRPYPAPRGNFAVDGDKDRIKMRKKGPSVSDQEDNQILQVVEAYCSSAKNRQTFTSAMMDSPQVLVAEDEKIMFEETVGGVTIMQEKTLVDTVYALKDQVESLQEDIKEVSKQLEKEQRARKRLEDLVKRHLPNTVIDKPAKQRLNNVVNG